MSKYRSRVNYGQVYAGDRQGINLGIDGAIFLRRESAPRVFTSPRIGTQGQSEGGDSASTDISAGSDDALQIAVDGGAVVAVALTLAGLTTGAAIAAELETKINDALLADGQDSRVWVEFDSGDDKYIVHSQFTGVGSSVVITDALADNVADDLNLGVANGGTETVGTDDRDFLLYTTGGPTFSQPIESNQHRSGRFHSGIVKAKKVSEFSITTHINMEGSAGDSIDEAVRLLWESLLGTEEVVSGTAIRYRQGLPNLYFSLVRVSTIFGEYYSGGYVRDMTLTLPGDGPGTKEWSGRAADRKIAGLAQIDGGVVASADVVLNAGEWKRYDVGAPVMVVAPDGQTILYGADGSLTIDSITELSNQLTLSGAVSVDDNGYIVPWNPGAVQQTGRDNIFTDLEGSIKLDEGGQTICATNITATFTNDHVDLDNCFGADNNEGFAAGNRLTIGLSVTFDLSNENFSEVVQSSKFEGFKPEIILGAATGRRLRMAAAKWIPSVPSIEVPENGVTPVTLEGNLYQSVPGARDPFLAEYL